MSAFKVGDKVRCIRASARGHPGKPGDILTISKVFPGGGAVNFVESQDIRGADIARFELVKAEPFKPGDRVRFKDNPKDQDFKSRWFPDQEILIVKGHDGDGCATFRDSRFVAAFDRLELVPAAKPYLGFPPRPMFPSIREVPHIVILDGASEGELMALQPATRPHTHPTKAAAEAEAKRLAKANPGKRFVVFAAVSQTTQPPANFPPVVTKGF